MPLPISLLSGLALELLATFAVATFAIEDSVLVLPKEAILPNVPFDPTQLITNELKMLENVSEVSSFAMKIEYRPVLLSTIIGSTV